MTIPEQAVAELRAAFTVWWKRYSNDGIGINPVFDAFKAGRESVASHMGVQRPEDVAPLERLIEHHVGAWIKEQSPDLQIVPTAAKQDIRELAKAVLALPHTGQPQEGARDLNVMALLKRLRRPDSYCADGCEGRCVECPDNLIRDTAEYIEHMLSAAPASPRAEGEPDYGEDVLGERPR